MAPLVSCLALALIALGVANRRRPAMHWRLMLAAFAIDVGMVLYLEGSRSAVERAATSIHPVIWVHAGISLGVLALWVAMLRLGWLMLHGQPARRHTHRLLATVFLVLRLANLGTSLVLPHEHPPTETALHR